MLLRLLLPLLDTTELSILNFCYPAIFLKIFHVLDVLNTQPTMTKDTIQYTVIFMSREILYLEILP